MQIEVALISKAGMNLDRWDNIEWFGIEELYVPYPWIDDYALGYGEQHVKGAFEVEVFETFPYLAAYRNQEYLFTIEFPFLTETGQVITVNNFILVDKGLRPSEICPGK